MSPRILISAFEPFDGRSRNASQVVLADLEADPPADLALATVLLPVRTELAARRLVAAIGEHEPHAVICLGEAKRDAVTPEQVAVNTRRFSIPDNAGRRVDGLPVIEGGPAELETTLPVAEMVDAMQAAGVPARLSRDAGRYLCNEVMYAALHHSLGSDRLVGFVHVPLLVEEAGTGEAGAAEGADVVAMEGKDLATDGLATAGVAIADTIRGVRAAVQVVAGALGARD
jgi:pyroglutamyl-peptidase